MRSYFGIAPERIQNKSASIDDYLPIFIRKHHSQFLRNFRLTGKFSRIGHTSKAFIVKNNIPYGVELKVFIFPAVDGLAYIGNMKVVGLDDHYALFDN